MKQVKYFLSTLLIIALISGSAWGQWVEENITNNGSNRPETSASHALDTMGNVHVAYIGDKDPKKKKTIYELFYDNNIGGSFSSREQITGGQFNSLDYVLIAVNGDVHIVFTATTENGNTMLYYIKGSSGSWSPPLAVSQPGLRIWGPNFRLSSLGHAHIVYSTGQIDGSPPEDIYYTENSSGSFSTLLNLTADPLFSGIGEEAAVALDDLDQVHIAFEVGIWDGIEPYSTNLHDIYYTNNVGGSLLANIIPIAVLEDIREEHPSLAVDGAGNIHIAYKEEDPITFNRKYIYLNNIGGSFGPGEVVFAAAGPGNYNARHLAIDSSDNVHLVIRNGSNQIEYATNSGGSGFATELVTSNTRTKPQIAVDGSGTAYILARNGTTDIYLYKSSGPPDPPAVCFVESIDMSLAFKGNGKPSNRGWTATAAVTIHDDGASPSRKRYSCWSLVGANLRFG